jgi:hypothetical protein
MVNHLFTSPEATRKFCKKMNKLFCCKEVYGCNVSCPFWIATEVERLMRVKNLSMGHALKCTVEQSIPEDKKREIINRFLREQLGCSLGELEYRLSSENNDERRQ